MAYFKELKLLELKYKVALIVKLVKIILVFIQQDNVKTTINAKKTTIARFNSIQNMWVGADYSESGQKWKWRNSYVDFEGSSN